jgi:hypothetical protein
VLVVPRAGEMLYRVRPAQAVTAPAPGARRREER